ncbi:hypothetical protein PENVUL_c002G01295 [Penicillium vulpinum]|uniref:Uncharacterized protein n=2 Tax=Penicillium vulpinum TaxID=29845 RepID=A0A1V6SC72_9EURO|nr:hypothetical protein PENVUL_c002G01295 [Penicillium vulpinum]
MMYKLGIQPPVPPSHPNDVIGRTPQYNNALLPPVSFNSINLNNPLSQFIIFGPKLENPSSNPIKTTTKLNQTIMPFETNQDKGATGAAKFVTSTLGNTVGGVTRTVGGVAGTAGRGIGDTITGAAGSVGEPVGNALGSASSGLESGAKRVAQGAEDAGQWK